MKILRRPRRTDVEGDWALDDVSRRDPADGVDVDLDQQVHEPCGEPKGLSLERWDDFRGFDASIIQK